MKTKREKGSELIECMFLMAALAIFLTTIVSIINNGKERKEKEETLETTNSFIKLEENDIERTNSLEEKNNYCPERVFEMDGYIIYRARDKRVRKYFYFTIPKK